MRFILVDKVLSYEPGKEIRTIKNISLAEEYLSDHFPSFPVLPGVFLLEGLIESASWLVRLTEEFSHSMILLEQVRNVKYKSFRTPGSQVEYRVEAKVIEEEVSSFKGVGVSSGEEVVSAKFALKHFNLASKDAGMASVDAKVTESLKERWGLLSP